MTLLQQILNNSEPAVSLTSLFFLDPGEEELATELFNAMKGANSNSDFSAEAGILNLSYPHTGYSNTTPDLQTYLNNSILLVVHHRSS